MPVFLVSFLFNEINISNKYLLFVLTFYTIIIVLNYLKNNIVTLLIDRFFLVLLSFFIFINNRVFSENVFVTLIVLIFCVVAVYIIAFFFYKKAGKSLILNFSKLSSLIESILVLFVLFLGIKNSIVVNVLLFTMIDIFYKVIILEITLNLKKMFSIQ